MIKEALKKVASDGQARRNQVKKRSLQKVNEHFKPDFNAAWPSAVVSQSFLKSVFIGATGTLFNIIKQRAMYLCETANQLKC